ncbi:hypothetical protein HJFPF1_10436 [Paramyrothecium foliicola]|nr:hypothetical protein HJFPF1_10436 [Paramyrothecium foliicola]
MACHQAQNIPWHVLAANFEYVYRHGGYEERTNLYPRFRESQGKELHHFVDAFANNVTAHAPVELHKYPKIVKGEDSESILLEDDVLKRISPSVHHCHKAVQDFHKFSEYGSSIPPDFKKFDAFLLPSDDLGWYGEDAMYSVELFKLLIIYLLDCL